MHDELQKQIKALDEEAARLVTVERNLGEHKLAQKDISESAARLVTIANKLREIRDGNAVVPCTVSMG